jgi:hypothetical protein
VCESKKTYSNKKANIETKTKAETIRKEQKVKLLLKKKQQIKKELYKTYIYNAKIWKQPGGNIEYNINTKIQTEMTKKHQQQK